MSVKIRVPNVPELSLDLGERANAHFASTGDMPNWEPLETQIFIKLLSEEPKFIDMGANIGWFSSIASIVSERKGSIFSFEPDINNFESLVNNITTNRLFNVHPYRMALSDQDASGHLYISVENLGDHRIGSVEGREAVPIEIVKLDTVLANTKFRPDLIKIDIQGAELGALNGAERTLAAAGKTCAKLIEFWPGGMKGGVQEAEALADLIFSWEQDVYAMHHEGSGTIRPLDRNTLREAVNGCIHPDKPSYIDLLVAPQDNRMSKIQHYIGPAWEPWE